MIAICRINVIVPSSILFGGGLKWQNYCAGRQTENLLLTNASVSIYLIDSLLTGVAAFTVRRFLIE